MYPGHATQYSLKICLGVAGIRDILQGPNLTAAESDDIQKQIVAELVTKTGTRIASAILFSDLPVEGWYRYADSLQILPPPKGAPRLDCLMRDHPLLLQFRFATSPNFAIRNIRKATRGREIVLMLTGLLAGSVRSLTGPGEHHWTILPHQPGTPLRTEYLQEGYLCSGFVEESDEFESVNGIPQLAGLEPNDYYSRWAISSESRFEVPDNLAQLLATFHELPDGQRDKFLRACCWFELSNKFYTHSCSAAFAALVSSIEALMPAQRGRKSITQRFKQFVDQMAPSSGAVEQSRRKLYRVRSELLHGVRLSPSDYLGLSPSPRSGEEFENLQQAQHVVKLVLANWLGSQAGLATKIRSDTNV